MQKSKGGSRKTKQVFTKIWKLVKKSTKLFERLESKIKARKKAKEDSRSRKGDFERFQKQQLCEKGTFFENKKFLKELGNDNWKKNTYNIFLEELKVILEELL